MPESTIPSPSPESPELDDERCEDRRRRRRRHGFVAGLAIGALVAGIAGFAIGAATPAAEAALGAFARHHHRGAMPDPAEAREHAGFFVSFALHRLDADREQEERMQALVGSAIDELFPLVEQHHANRDRLRAILGAAAIDREGLEALRAEELALLDAASRVLAGTLADGAEVLTAAQRAEVVEHLARFHGRH